MYRARWDEIEEIEVLRETDKQVVLLANDFGKECRENKQSEWQNWFNTWEQAHQFILTKADEDVKSLRLQLEQANGKYGQIKGMKTPA